MTPHDPGEKPRNPNRDEAREKARKVLDDPRHHKPKGSLEDESTIDGALDAPEGDV